MTIEFHFQRCVPIVEKCHAEKREETGTRIKYVNALPML